MKKVMPSSRNTAQRPRSTRRPRSTDGAEAGGLGHRNAMVILSGKRCPGKSIAKKMRRVASATKTMILSRDLLVPKVHEEVEDQAGLERVMTAGPDRGGLTDAARPPGSAVRTTKAAQTLSKAEPGCSMDVRFRVFAHVLPHVSRQVEQGQQEYPDDVHQVPVEPAVLQQDVVVLVGSARGHQHRHDRQQRPCRPARAGRAGRSW